jgi:hypothetical protein
MARRVQAKSGTKITKRKKLPPMAPRIGGAKPLCACKCGMPAEIEFAGLPYTKACLQREMDEMRTMGLPIEQLDEGTFRLKPGTRVSFADEGDPTKVH